MSLGDRLFAWLRQVWGYAVIVPPLSYIVNAINIVRGGLRYKPGDATQALINTLASTPNPTSLAMALGLSAATGKPMPEQFGGALAEAQKMLADPRGYMAQKIGQIASDPNTQAAASAYYGIIDSVVLGRLNHLAATAEDNPFAVIAELTLGAQLVNLVGGAIGVASEIVGAGQVETIQTVIDKAVELAGLPEVQAIALRPLLEAGIAPASERFFNKFYRPARLSPQQLLTLQALGVIGEGYANDEIAREGFRDADIGFMRELLYDRLDASTYIRAREFGLIGDGTLYDKLLTKRFKGDDARLLVELSEHERLQGWGERIFSLALRMYGKYQIDDAGLSKIARSAGFTDERIEFEVRAARMLRQSEATDLSVSEIEGAFKKGVLSETEAANYLTKIQIEPEGIPILLATWKAQDAKAPLHLNVSELTAAFHDNVIDEAGLSARLRSLGWSAEDTRILVTIAKWRAPEKPRPLSEGIVITAYHHKVVSHDEAIELMKRLGFSDEDAHFILRAETILPPSKHAELSVAQIAKLVEVNVLSKENALARLRGHGYSADDAELVLIAETTKVPHAPKQSKPPKTSPPVPLPPIP